jgi:hypothetical protein
LPIDQFVAVLKAYGIERLVDIRTMPRSRHNPQFNATALTSSLATAHLEYECPASAPRGHAIKRMLDSR